MFRYADRLGPEVGGRLALWAAFISPRPCNDSLWVGSCYGALEIVGVIIIIIMFFGLYVSVDCVSICLFFCVFEFVCFQFL